MKLPAASCGVFQRRRINHHHFQQEIQEGLAHRLTRGDLNEVSTVGPLLNAKAQLVQAGGTVHAGAPESIHGCDLDLKCLNIGRCGRDEFYLRIQWLVQSRIHPDTTKP